MSLRSLKLPSRVFGALTSVAVIAGLMLVGHDDSPHAQDLFGIFGGGNGGGDIFGAPQQPQGASPDGGATQERRHRRKHAKKSSADDEGSGSGYTSMCVRTCDGYTFPVGSYRGDGDRPAHEAACRSQCPGAKTTLYLRPGGSDAIEDSVRADTKQSYAKLPAAFKFKSEHSETCTCHLAGAPVRMSFARDFTLRRGDVVMTEDGLKVFHGGTGFPFRPIAFSPLLHSRDVARKDLAVLQAMDRARLRVDQSRELTVTRKRGTDAPPTSQ